jgi:hypothetical protein
MGMSTPADLLQWSAWRLLATVSRDQEISRLPGLYRIRRLGRNDLDYIGQTSLPLRRRLAMLRGVYKEEMPYADPHTAAPALWALRHATGCDFECSVVPIEGSTPWRKGMEAVAIALYRQEFGQSPTIEFGRIMAGYRPSSGNNSRLAAVGKRFRGGPSDEPHFRHVPGIAPAGPLAGDPHGVSWGGHTWSAWIPLHQLDVVEAVTGSGLYRIRGDEDVKLLYIGQGKVPDRPLAHLGKIRQADHRQGPIFAAHSRLEWSAVVNEDWHQHQRLELENDLIAAHILTTGEVPAAQFLDGMKADPR